MRHRKSGRKLGRNGSHRRALFKNMANAFFEHDYIRTTVAKAKELRPFVEKLVTISRKDSLHARRLVISRIGNHRIDHDEFSTVVQKLFSDIGPRFMSRPGGYTRITRLSERRLGDGGPLALLSFVDVDTTKRERDRAAAAKADAEQKK